MNKLPPEEIDGKLYQPVEADPSHLQWQTCRECAFRYADCGSIKCRTNEREDGLNVYFI